MYLVHLAPQHKLAGKVIKVNQLHGTRKPELTPKLVG